MAFYGNPYAQPYNYNLNFQRQQMMQPQMQQVEQNGYMQQSYPQNPQSYPQQVTQNTQPLQGRIVESADIIKIIETPLDGSTSFFPLSSGTEIISKQLQNDGTIKMRTYKLVDDDEPLEQPKYITEERFNEFLNENSKDTLDEEIKALKRQIRDLQDDIKEIQKRKGDK